jgi:hypothetical protein
MTRYEAAMKDRMTRLMAEELAAALRLRERLASEDPTRMFSAGVADGIRSCASWLGIAEQVDIAANRLNGEE